MSYQPRPNYGPQYPQSQGGYAQPAYPQPPQQQAIPADVTQLAATYRLGTLLRQYKNTATSGMVLGIILIVLGVAFILLCLLLLLSSGLSRGFFSFLSLGIGLLVYGISRIRKAVRNEGAQFYLCSEGVMRVQAATVQTMRWDQITAVQEAFTSSRSSYYLSQYILYQTGRAPLVLEKSFSAFKELGTEIERQVVQHQLPGAIAAYQAGHPVNFGTVDVLPQGLGVPAKQKVLSWEELGDVSVSNGHTVIKKKGALLAWERLSISQMRNLCVFLPLVNYIRGK